MDGGEVVARRCREEGKTLFWASNFSIGVAIFSAVNRYLAGIMNQFGEYDAHIEETHHVHKLDHPSGTAITLAEDIIEKIDRKKLWLTGTHTQPDGNLVTEHTAKSEELAINSVREGEVAGIHSVVYESEADSITIRHEAHSRKGFALGAVLAAEYTAQHTGLLTINDMFKM